MRRLLTRKRPLLRLFFRLSFRLSFSIAALGGIGFGGCSAGGGGKIDAAFYDGALDLNLGDLPSACYQTAANDKGVGASCTKGGHQCGNLQCTCDPYLGFQTPPGTPCFCTVVGPGLSCPADPAGPCGAATACCPITSAGNALGYLCIPDVCLEGGACPGFLSQ